MTASSPAIARTPANGSGRTTPPAANGAARDRFSVTDPALRSLMRKLAALCINDGLGYWQSLTLFGAYLVDEASRQPAASSRQSGKENKAAAARKLGLWREQVSRMRKRTRALVDET